MSNQLATRYCVDCGVPLIGGPNAQRCAEHGHDHMRKMQRARYHRRAGNDVVAGACDSRLTFDGLYGYEGLAHAVFAVACIDATKPRDRDGRKVSKAVRLEAVEWLRTVGARWMDAFGRECNLQGLLTKGE